MIKFQSNFGKKKRHIIRIKIPLINSIFIQILSLTRPFNLNQEDIIESV